MGNVTEEYPRKEDEGGAKRYALHTDISQSQAKRADDRDEYDRLQIGRSAEKINEPHQMTLFCSTL